MLSYVLPVISLVVSLGAIGYVYLKSQALGRFRQAFARMHVEREALRTTLLRAGYGTTLTWTDNKLLVQCYPNGNVPEMTRTKHEVTAEELRDASMKAGLN